MLEHDPLVDGAPDGAGATPVWAAFGDLMTGVLGAFVLILAFALVMQMDLAQQLARLHVVEGIAERLFHHIATGVEIDIGRLVFQAVEQIVVDEIEHGITG